LSDIGENEIKKKIANSEGFSLMISRMNKLEAQNNTLIELTLKYQEDFQEMTKENKILKERLKYLSETNKEYCTMNNILKYDLDERKNISATVISRYKT
jgi:hypothetical protein